MEAKVPVNAHSTNSTLLDVAFNLTPSRVSPSITTVNLNWCNWFVVKRLQLLLKASQRRSPTGPVDKIVLKGPHVRYECNTVCAWPVT